jgi:hypothetical protein
MFETLPIRSRVFITEIILNFIKFHLNSVNQNYLEFHFIRREILDHVIYVGLKILIIRFKHCYNNNLIMSKVFT